MKTVDMRGLSQKETNELLDEIAAASGRLLEKLIADGELEDPNLLMNLMMLIWAGEWADKDPVTGGVDDFSGAVFLRRRGVDGERAGAMAGGSDQGCRCGGASSGRKEGALMRDIWVDAGKNPEMVDRLLEMTERVLVAVKEAGLGGKPLLLEALAAAVGGGLARGGVPVEDIPELAQSLILAGAIQYYIAMGDKENFEKGAEIANRILAGKVARGTAEMFGKMTVN